MKPTLLLLCACLTGCAFLPKGSDLEGRVGFSKESGPTGKVIIRIPLSERIVYPPGAPFALYVSEPL